MGHEIKKTRIRSSVVCVHDGRLLGVLLQDPATRRVEPYVPGGAIEPGESPAAAAVRETLEETGYAVAIAPQDAAGLVARYDFVWGGVPFDCTTHFFRARLAAPGAAPAPVRDAAYNLGVEWIPRTDVAARLGYHEPILRAVLALLD